MYVYLGIAVMYICHAVVLFLLNLAQFGVMRGLDHRLLPPFNAVFVKIACSCTSAIGKDFPTSGGPCLLSYCFTPLQHISHGKMASHIVMLVEYGGRK